MQQFQFKLMSAKDAASTDSTGDTHEKDETVKSTEDSKLGNGKTYAPPTVSDKERLAASLAFSQATEAKALPVDTAIDEATRQRVDDTQMLHIPKPKLIDDDFPFDDSQLIAIRGMSKHAYCCMTGAAGTGKTTCTKAIVQALNQEVSTVDVANYSRGSGATKVQESYTPAIALCAFTGKATEQIKKNFPEEWHDNIMTIHYLLGFQPVYYEEVGDDGNIQNKMRFEPQYDAHNKHPWDIIIIDEASMLAVDLWHQLWTASKPTTRIYMIGDINQLPPVHGNSIFGFALAQWPSYELTHIHRQKGEHNPIVDNAWRVLKGESPKSEGHFYMLEMSDSVVKAVAEIKHTMLTLKKRGSYDPIRDIVITPINGHAGSRGYELGQLPLNDYMALEFNPDSTRYLIDAGKEKRGFGINDKIMVTKNDREAGLTNGMVGIITSIEPNGAYAGNLSFVGEVNWVKENLKQLGDSKVSISDLTKLGDEVEEYEEDPKLRHSSHLVTVDFDGKERTFSTASEVGSLMLAYIVTCHKSQGSEYPLVIIICHNIHKAMMYREWLYTAITRASGKVLLMYNRSALLAALRKQKIKGATLEEKKVKFIELASSKFRKPVVIPNPRRIDDEDD